VFIGTKSTPREGVRHGGRRLVEIRANRRLIVVLTTEPRDRTVEVRTRHRLSTGLATECEPGEAPWRVAHLRRTRSSARRVSASATTEKTDMTSSAVMPPRCRLITVGRNFDAAATSSSTVLAPPMAWRRWNDDFVSIAMRSWSSTMPRTRPDAEVTGKCLTPRSSMSNRTSLPDAQRSP